MRHQAFVGSDNGVIRLALSGIIIRRNFLEQPEAKERCQRYRKQPAETERDQDHPEQVARVFGRVSRRKSDGRKRDDTDERAAEQRPLGLIDDGLRYLEFLRAIGLHDDDIDSLLTALSSMGVATTLLSDDSEVNRNPLANHFTSASQLKISSPEVRAERVEETQLAQVFAAAVDELKRATPPHLLWIHAQGLASAWDAPLALRRSLMGDEDPDPPSGVEVPAEVLPRDYDPDALFGIVQACAGQVLVLDTCLGVLLDAVRAKSASEDVLFLLTSPRGFPLGEHLRVGDVDDVLYGELVHLPCLIRRSDGVGAMARDHALVQATDIAATLADWFGLGDSFKTAGQASSATQTQSLLPLTEPMSALWPRDRVCSETGGERAIRTHAWFLRRPADGKPELYRKPDDLWETNEIADRCANIVEQLLAALNEFQQAATEGDFSRLSALSEELTEGIE